MQLHRNAKLGLHGRLELVLAIERGLSLKAAAAAFVAGDGPPLVEALARRSRGGARLACLPMRSIVAAETLRADAAGE
jgi:hypothetical protein